MRGGAGDGGCATARLGARSGCASVAKSQLCGARRVDCRLSVRLILTYSVCIGLGMWCENLDKLGGLNLMFTNVLCIYYNDYKLNCGKTDRTLRCRGANSISRHTHC